MSLARRLLSVIALRLCLWLHQRCAGVLLGAGRDIDER